MEQKEAQSLFSQLFGGEAEDLFTAAGRINVIGEHVDYCGGKVFPAALNLRCNVYGRKNGQNVIRVAASDFKEVVTLDIGKLDSYKSLKWGNYQAGVAYYLQESGTPIVGCDLLYDCTVPFGSGLSSSAAIEVSTAVALSEYAGGGYDKVKLALLSQKAENKYAGVNCGIMDQFASAMGKKDHAILLDCSTLEYEYVPLQLGEYRLVVANCNKPHNLVESKYNVRRHEVETALKAINTIKPVPCLAALSPKEFNEVKYVLSGVVSKRAEHVVMECARVKEAVAALKSVPTVPCTNCRYCVKECPQGVKIPEIMGLLNLELMVEDREFVKGLYSWQAAAGPASTCIECGACEQMCPQSIDIIDQLALAAKRYE